MTKQERFMLFVYLGSIARAQSHPGGRRQCEIIADYASRIPEQRIPPNVMNAARVYVRFMEGRTRPFRWMDPAAVANVLARETKRRMQK
jgi:hypothetical protein